MYYNNKDNIDCINKGGSNMRKIVVNYTSNKKAKRLVIDRDLPFGAEMLYAILFLHAAKVVNLDNVLAIKEEVLSA